MVFDYLKGGLIAGGLAGVVYGLFMAFVGNPMTDFLHDYGHGHDHDHGHSHESAHAVAESTTALVSIGSGLLWAIFLGGLFAVALFVFEPALPGTRAAKSVLLAGVGFFSISVTPWLVVPPAAPGAENLYGIDSRLAIYGALVVVGLVTSAAAISIYKRTMRHGRLLAVAASGLPIFGVLVVVPLVTPTVVAHPELPADLVGAYQAMVVLSQAAVWGIIAVTYNWLQRRAESPQPAYATAQPQHEEPHY